MATYDKQLMVLNSAGNYDKHHVETNANIINGLGVSTLENTTYTVGDIVISTDNLKCQFRCTQAGTTDITSRPAYGSAQVGDTITDGTAKFVAEPKSNIIAFSDLINKPSTLAGYGVTDPTKADNLSPIIYHSAAAHNGIPRGKYLGSSVTAAQWAAIKAGTFDDLYIGDYWTIGGIDYVIAAFDYYLHCGDKETTVHHVTIVPRKNMYNHVMNDTNVVTGAYIGSKMYKSGLNSAKTTIANAFGSNHILTIRQLYTNATNADYGFGTGFAWYDDSVYLMNEMNVYGSYVFTEFYRTTQWGSDKYSPDNSQFPVFAFDKTMIHTRETYWLRNVASSDGFANVGSNGRCNDYYASYALGVRPAFNIYNP